MDTSTLNDLIDRCKQKDEKAFRPIVESYQTMIYSVAFRVLCNVEEAKDIVQETFLRVWMNLAKFQKEKKFSTWIYAIATNLCLDKLKSTKNQSNNHTINESIIELISHENPEQKLINSELAEIIMTLTNELTPKQKVVFTLRYLEELEVEEIMQITGLSSQKIKSNLFLARQTIRQKLEKY